METAWIQIFILSMTQCIAPEGKMVCQEATVEYQFAEREDCQRALTQMLDMAERADNVLIDRSQSQCNAATRESQIFASVDDVRDESGNNDALQVVGQTSVSDTRPPDFTKSAHEARLESLKRCEDTAGVAPCRIGEIIVEAAAPTKKTEIWRRQP